MKTIPFGAAVVGFYHQSYLMAQALDTMTSQSHGKQREKESSPFVVAISKNLVAAVGFCH